MKTRVCQICGKGFAPSCGSQRYCSPGCRREANNARRREYRREHTEEVRARSREYYRKHKDRIALHQWEYRERHKDEIRAREREYRARNRERIREYHNWYRNGGCVEIMARGSAGAAKKAEEPGEWGRDWMETSRLADEKPENCLFGGSCLECPYPECVED